MSEKRQKAENIMTIVLKPYHPQVLLNDESSFMHHTQSGISNYVGSKAIYNSEKILRSKNIFLTAEQTAAALKYENEA